MKNILTILLVATSHLTFGQIATLDLNNPAPRVGDEIEITVYFQKQILKVNEGKKTHNDWKAIQDNNLGKGELKFYDNVLDTGLIKIGPLKFTINNKEFTSETLTIRVYPILPNSKDGIWSRLVAFKGEIFLILEQRVSNQWKPQVKSDDEHSFTHSSDGINWAEIDIEGLKQFGVNLEQVNSNIRSEIVDKNDTFGSGTASYKLTKYKVTKQSNFKDKLRITKELFINYPDKIELPITIIE